MDFGFETKRTGLANAFADAGEALMSYMGTDAALAAIPNTEPQQYVVAGTLPMIAKMLPGVEPTSSAVAPSQVPAELTDERIYSIYETIDWGEIGAGIEYARAIEREVRLSAVREARNEALADAEREIATCFARGGPPDDPHPDAVIYNDGVQSALESVRELRAASPAASKEGGKDNG